MKPQAPTQTATSRGASAPGVAPGGYRSALVHPAVDSESAGDSGGDGDSEGGGSRPTAPD